MPWDVAVIGPLYPVSEAILWITLKCHCVPVSDFVFLLRFVEIAEFSHPLTRRQHEHLRC
jgi:hypothetical protein